MKSLMLAAALAVASGPALAAEHVIRMLNSGENGERMVFEPSFVQAKAGDTVVFEPVDNGHASTSIMVPPGADTWEAGLNDETRLTLSQPGVYLFKSRPHFALGMIGMIVVDNPAPNREAIDGFKPRGSMMRERFEALKGQL